MQGMHIPSGTRELGMPLVSPKLHHPLDESSKMVSDAALCFKCCGEGFFKEHGMTGQEGMALNSRECRVRWGIGTEFSLCEGVSPWPMLEGTLKPVPSHEISVPIPWDFNSHGGHPCQHDPIPQLCRSLDACGENKPAERSFAKAF